MATERQPLGGSFWRLFASSTSSNLSDGVLQAALPLVAASLTRDPVLVSLVAFTLIYAILAVVEFGLIFKTVREGPQPLPGPDDPDPSDLPVDQTPSTVY